MPNRTTSHETDKLDHSTHPTTHATKDDLRAPGGGSPGARPQDKTAEKPKRRQDAGTGQAKGVTPSRP
jgi:hypothetical protein